MLRYRYAFAPGTPSTLLFDIDEALGFQPRADLVAYVDEQENQLLCGAGAQCVG